VQRGYRVQRDVRGRGGADVVREWHLGVWRLLMKTAAVFFVLAFALGVCASNAHADETTVIYGARAPIGYGVEIEPHLLLGTSPPGNGAGSGAGIGARGSVVVAPDGFIRGVNDSIAISFGLDVGHYSAAWGLNGYRDQCLHFEPGPAGTSICTEVTSNGGTSNYVYVPIVMQWNFWLTQRWSVFGEPGLNTFFLANHGAGIAPALYLGGRFQITDRITITARLGYPTFTLGASFFL
jgi:hypothetical protein